MKKIIIVIILLAAAIIGVIFLSRQLRPAPSPEIKNTPVVIGLSLGAVREERWTRDRDLFIAKAKELGAVVNEVETDYDVDTQISQIENLISQGVKVIVVVPADSVKIAPIIAEAHAAGVKIIAYERIINDSDLDFYVSFDNVKIGELEAKSVLDVASKGNFAYIGGAPTDNNAFLVKQGSMAVLKPAIDKGDIKLVLDEFTTNWDPSEAYKTMKKYLSTGKTVDAIVAANDGTAFGVIQALTEKGLAGKVPVSGQDAELAACQRIVAGTQTATVYKPLQSEATQAAEMAVAIARGELPATNNVVNNGKIDVPSYILGPAIIVNKDNMMDTVIKDNFHTYQEIYGHAQSSQ